jgi:hypothetical protein
VPFCRGHFKKRFFWPNRSIVNEDIYAVEFLNYCFPDPSDVVNLSDITHRDMGAYTIAPGLLSDCFTGAPV